MPKGRDTSRNGARIVDLAAYKARKMTAQRRFHPSVSTAVPYDWAKEDPDLGYEGSVDSDPTPPHGTVRPTLTDKEKNDD